MLADCYECGKEISSEASRCPYCGYYYQYTHTYKKAGGGYRRGSSDDYGYVEPPPNVVSKIGNGIGFMALGLVIGAMTFVALLVAVPVIAFLGQFFGLHINWDAVWIAQGWIAAIGGVLAAIFFFWFETK